MEAHSCHYCDNIIFELTDADRYQTSIERTLNFKTSFVKCAARDRCLFFYWTLALHEGDVAEDGINNFLDAHIANLPGVVYDGEEDDEQAEAHTSGSEMDEKEDAAKDGDEQRYDAASGVHDAASDGDGERSGTDEEDTASNTEVVSLRDTKLRTSSGEVLNATQRETPDQLALHLEFSSIGPKRCVVTRDMASIKAPKRPSIYWAGPEMEFAVLKESKLADRIDTRPMVADPTSPESFALARSWLSTCVDEHCHTFARAFSMPSRLLEVNLATNGEINARIVSTENSGHVPYLTLSYCWGDDQSSKTTRQSLVASGGRINTSNLPKTLLDAIIVTIRMGYSYLWVDSLCIVQDDVDDQTKEIAKMPGIYNNAVCSIAASFPTNCNEGFLRRRSKYTGTVMKLRAQKTIYDEEHNIHSAKSDPDTVLAHLIDPEESLATEALSTRGWCLQERLLSNRVLEYRRNQVRFLCPSTGTHDKTKVDGWVNDWPSNNTGDIVFLYDSERFVPATLLGYNIETIADFRRLWYSIVEAYCQRHLTFSADRTLAISGIAQQISLINKAIPQDSYTAGHWGSEFPHNLLWFWRCPDWTTNRRATRRSPTWAWTSIDTEVQYPQQFHEHKQQAAEFVGLDVKLKNSDAPYGDVEEATLTLKGRITSNASVRVTGLEYLPRDITLHNKTTGEELCDAWLDTMTGPEHDEYCEDVVLLLIGIVDREGREYDEAAGLVLFEEPSRGSVRTFSRIGAWTVVERLQDGRERSSMMQLFEGCDPETINLV